MVGVGGLSGFAHAVTLHRLRKNDRRLAAVLHSLRVGGEHLDGIVPSAREFTNLLIAHVRNPREKNRVDSEEVLPDESAVTRLENLILTVKALHHPPAQPAIVILGQQLVPAAAPN